MLRDRRVFRFRCPRCDRHWTQTLRVLTTRTRMGVRHLYFRDDGAPTSAPTSLVRECDSCARALGQVREQPKVQS